MHRGPKLGLKKRGNQKIDKCRKLQSHRVGARSPAEIGGELMPGIFRQNRAGGYDQIGYIDENGDGVIRRQNRAGHYEVEAEIRGHGIYKQNRNGDYERVGEIRGDSVYTPNRAGGFDSISQDRAGNTIDLGQVLAHLFGL